MKDKFTVGNVARISREKNINRFFDIARLLPQYEFRWVGGILPMWEEYARTYIKEKPSNVTITGYIQEGIEEEFNKLDMFVLTSDNEGMPLAVLEAMASGLPVISTKVGNLHKILDRDYFYERPEEAAMLIREYAENKQKRNRIGDENRKIICGQYDIISMMKQYDILFKRMVGR
jgi:glycosyltransferase involved in cell wall biosynthesis